MIHKALMLAALLTAACASAERPPALTALDSVRESPSVQESKRSAPQAYAEAEQLAAQAAAAWRGGDRDAAQHWGSMAAAAYQQAIALSRRARAEETTADAARSVDRLRKELSEVAAEQARLDAETSNLELQMKVIQDAQPLTAVESANPKRNRARRAAARAWLTEAKLLCISETLVVGERSGATNQLIEAIAQALEPLPLGDAAKLVEEARQLRGACLERLTLARRPAARKAPQSGLSDALLSRLSKVQGLHPFRDDRGVVVILSAPASRSGLTPAAQGKLREVANVVAAAPDSSLLVVWHAAGGPDTREADEALLEEAVRILDPGGSIRVVRELLGQDQPLVDPSVQGARERNFRLEVVFVTPTSS